MADRREGPMGQKIESWDGLTKINKEGGGNRGTGMSNTGPIPVQKNAIRKSGGT